MSLQPLLAELRSRDVRIWAEGDRLRCNAPAGALTPDLREQLQHRKAEILEFLRAAESLARQQPAIVPLQPRGARTPVFGAGGHNGDVFAFRDLARCLGEDQPFFGLHPPGLEIGTRPLPDVGRLACYFADQIQAFRHDGPYIIAGYCAGGAVALEVARQLAARGARVGLLALFGCMYPSSYRFFSSLPYWAKRMFMHAGAVARHGSNAQRREYLYDRLRLRLKAWRDERAPAATDALSITRFDFEQATMKAVRRYRPRAFSGRVALFLPNRRWLTSGEDALRWGDPALRWRSLLPQAEVYYGPDSCDPNRMLLEPDAAAFARLFEACHGQPAPAIGCPSSPFSDPPTRLPEPAASLEPADHP